ncbi:MAG: DUF2752 domain-containing protein [Clostridiaceae bacterium]|jgi:hypothetical protein|nr:DUF2752 domain-containing protein [Clostridiaceae bacterium]
MKKAWTRFKKALRQQGFLWAGLTAFFLLAWLLTGTGCTFASTTGLPCPGCGLTRALAAALHGDLALAFRLHPLFWLAPLILAAVLVLLAVAPDKLSSPRLNALWIGLAILFMVVYLIRMALLFPDQEPMIWNEQAVLPRLFRFLAGLWHSG